MPDTRSDRTAMLEEIMNAINNRFEQSRRYREYRIHDGDAGITFLADGQYYWVQGSVFNDGLHLFGDNSDVLQDEVFTGYIAALAVPMAVKVLADDIAEWCEANAQEIASPYKSESFGGYSYSFKDGGGSDGGSYSWKDQFRARLNAWRKL